MVTKRLMLFSIAGALLATAALSDLSVAPNAEARDGPVIVDESVMASLSSTPIVIENVFHIADVRFAVLKETDETVIDLYPIRFTSLTQRPVSPAPVGGPAFRPSKWRSS